MAEQTLGARIRAAREAKDWTQQQLAEAVGIRNQSAVAKWESGMHVPSLDALLRLADALGLTFDLTIRPRTRKRV